MSRPLILTAIGTRPEVIKAAPVLRALRAHPVDSQVVATGQHHDFQMMGAFLRDLEVHVDHELARSSNGLAESFLEILGGLIALCVERRPRMVLAVGDTTTVLAAALAARKTGALFGHVEAGLRAFSRELPEEEHRIAADAFADLLFAPTQIAVENLQRERVNGEIVLTGNTVLDSLRHGLKTSFVPPDARRGVLVTVHRQETVDRPAALAEIMTAVGELARHHDVLWPVHPRTRDRAARAGLPFPQGVGLVDPIGHHEFLNRLASARLVVTDSGGVQEEAAILGTPCIAVRDCTERPETIAAGAGLLAGASAAGIARAASQIFADWATFAQPRPGLYGQGNAGEIVAAACVRAIAASTRQNGVA